MYFENLDKMLAFNPQIIAENRGSEPIGSIRIEVTQIFGIIDMIGMLPEQQREKNPWAMKQFDRKDYMFSSKLLPGQKVRINIIAGLVSQMQQVQNSKFGDRLHLGTFHIKCFAKLVGAEAFDEMEQQPIVQMTFGWKPNGFTKERCLEFLKEFDAPPVSIDERNLVPTVPGTQ